MLVSMEEVQSLTGYTVGPAAIAEAQTIIEVFVGRTEPDLEDPRDIAMMARAVAFQAAYMQEHGKMIYEQISLQSMAVGGTIYTFKQGDTASPWIAPLAILACSKLSFVRSRGVKTGRMSVPQTRLLSWWTED